MGLAVLSQKVDIANVRLSRERMHRELHGEPGQHRTGAKAAGSFSRTSIFRWTLRARIWCWIDVTGMAAMGREKLAAMEAGTHPSGGLSLSNVVVEKGEPLGLEIAAFLDAVRTRAVPVVTRRMGVPPWGWR